MMRQIARNVNILAEFCGMRDVESLTAANLQKRYGIREADVMVLFGGSILCGGDVLAQAMQDRIARKYVIVGGEGHTTQTLREKVHEAYPSIDTEGLPEAEVFQRYLSVRYGLHADFLEAGSTNCGNNITNLLELLQENRIDFRSIVLCQDATMQRRMDAGLRKFVSEEIRIINYAAYQAEVTVEADRLVYGSQPCGMWKMDRYIELLMGEIPRLSDNADGYGPRGKDYIAHVEIPQEVRRAFEELRKTYSVREANSQYA